MSKNELQEEENDSLPRNEIISRIDTLLEDPVIAHFIYYVVIVITGWFFLWNSIGENGIVFRQVVMFMGAWMVIILFLQPPKGAQIETEAFEHVDIVEQLADKSSDE